MLLASVSALHESDFRNTKSQPLRYDADLHAKLEDFRNKLRDGLEHIDLLYGIRRTPKTMTENYDLAPEKPSLSVSNCPNYKESANNLRDAPEHIDLLHDLKTNNFTPENPGLSVSDCPEYDDMYKRVAL
ncbi:hypothetical protein SARC_08619 [Sphaeroforma arctica JP610]|uniref:Uncharacterized protein n=1 Tax=Sphaeroforma arctica JP610 TaxID=667725 RepID=A0A0L0FSL2_9EUKA|nr:hypothetical protein SARC_08619 [Sphaeroforma arctica JP610]KNC78973.1 hypothetical protein SARC_08619 [Sphaeroforma arctica JP610]|eukprot:XP_014152875.1 hypothetical protein SARC_08619 [Sphaeroforma arctica JP610]